MPTKSKKSLRLRKKRLHSVLHNSEDWSSVVALGYSVLTQDYTQEQVSGRVCDVSSLVGVDDSGNETYGYRPPLWDWWTLVNKKRNKLWYVDFSFPYTNSVELRDLESGVTSLPELRTKLSHQWADHDAFLGFDWVTCTDYPRNLKLKELVPRTNEETYKVRYEYYYNNVDWERVVHTYVERLRFNENYSGPLQTRRSSTEEWSLVVPQHYSERTFTQIYEEALRTFPNSPRVNHTHDALVKEVCYEKYYK